MKRLIIALATAGLLAIPATASAATRLPAAGPTVCDYNPPQSDCLSSNLKFNNSYWAYSTTNNNWYASTGNKRGWSLLSGSGSFQRITDLGRSNQCLTLVWSDPSKMIQDHTCGTASTQQWHWVMTDPMLSQWAIDNQWLDNNHPTLCAGSFVAVLSIFVSGGGPTGPLGQVCPDAGTGKIGQDQQWIVQAPF